MKITNFADPLESLSMVGYHKLVLGEDMGVNNKAVFFHSGNSSVYQSGLVSNFNPNRVAPRRPKRETPNIKDKV